VLRGAHPDLAPEHRDYLIRRFRLPEPRTELGPRLCGIAHAMIDVSDGLLADLGHICETSRVAAMVELDLLPLSPAARAIVEGDLGTRARLATAGDDYELVFAAPADAAETIATLSLLLGIPVTRIGRVDLGTGVRLINSDGHQIALEATGYRHF
jgi:thiamine-monophosphate kinase